MNSQETRTPLRYLVLGSTGYGGVESVDWLEGELPNFVDYDFIIVDVPALTLDRLALADLKRLERIRSQLVRFLHSGGTLIIITNPTISHKRPKRYPEVITNYFWSPIKIGTRLEKGRTMVTKQAEFKTYLTLLSDWDYLFFIPSDSLSIELIELYGPTHETKYRVTCKPILENRYGMALAEGCHIEIYYQRTKQVAYGSPYTEYPKKPDHLTGDIILLPRILDLDNRQAVSLVLQEITGLPQQTLSPEWADKLIVPGVTDLLAQIDRKLQQIRALETEISKLNENVDALNEYKRLVYATGSELESIVERCFKEIGGQVNPAKYSQEEFVLIYGGTEYLVEVKGASKSIALSHLRQLNDYLLKFQEDTGQICKGILFGNAWCTLPPQNRDKAESAVFPDNVTKRAEKWEIALISSINFYQAFMGFLEHGQGDSILDAVTTQKGIVKFA